DEAGQAFEEPETTLSAEFGGSVTTGNTDFYNLSAGMVGAHQSGRNKVGLEFSTLFGRSMIDRDGDGIIDEVDKAQGRETTAKRFKGSLRYDRFLGERLSLYALTGLLVDQLAGFDRRTHQQV